MFEALAEGLGLIFQWQVLAYFALGCVVGIVLGAVPGMGGAIGLVLLLPFTFAMEPVAAFALLLSSWASTSTSGAITSVLLGVPSTAASQATVLDGYPMAKQGQASRALGASFTSSAIGGVCGAAALGIILGSVIAARLLYWIFGNIFKKLASRTETKLDEIIVDMVEEPVVLVLTIAGIWYGLSTLELPEVAHTWIGHILQAAIILTAAWLLARLADSLFKQYLVPIASRTETDLDDQLLPIVRKGTKMIIWSVGIIVALNNAGYDVGALIAGLGIGGLALAMAARRSSLHASPAVSESWATMALATFLTSPAMPTEIGLVRPMRSGFMSTWMMEASVGQ